MDPQKTKLVIKAIDLANKEITVGELNSDLEDYEDVVEDDIWAEYDYHPNLMDTVSYNLGLAEDGQEWTSVDLADFWDTLKREAKDSGEEEEAYWKKYLNDSDYNQSETELLEDLWEKAQQYRDRVEMEEAMKELIEGETDVKDTD